MLTVLTTSSAGTNRDPKLKGIFHRWTSGAFMFSSSHPAEDKRISGTTQTLPPSSWLMLCQQLKQCFKHVWTERGSSEDRIDRRRRYNIVETEMNFSENRLLILFSSVFTHPSQHKRLEGVVEQTVQLCAESSAGAVGVTCLRVPPQQDVWKETLVITDVQIGSD